MTRRRNVRDQTWQGFWDSNGEYLTWWTVGLVALGLLAMGCMAAGYADNVDKNDALIAHVQTLHTIIDDGSLSVDQRKQLATQILYLDQHGGVTDITAGTANNEKIAETKAALQVVADTGNQLELTIAKMPWGEYWSVWVVWLAIVLVLCLMTAWMLIDGYVSDSENYFLIDRDWKRVWPVVWLILTLLPVGWIFYAVSFVRLARFNQGIGQLRDDRRRLLNQFGAIIPNDYDTYYTLRDQVEGLNRRLGLNTQSDIPQYLRGTVVTAPEAEVEIIQPPQPSPVFLAAPEEGLRCYIDMRERAGTADLKQRRSASAITLETVEDRLRSLGDEVGRFQTQRRTLRADVARLDDLLQSSQLLDPASATAEFESLLRLKGVESVRVVDGQLSLLVKARVTYKKKLYDAGDWELRFGVGTGLFSHELRSGVRKDWPNGRYPDYRFSDGSFCFGSRADVIMDNLAKGQFPEAIELAVNCMCSVNKADQDCIPKALYRIKDQESDS